MPTILSKYELKDIYNADEFGLLYQALSDKSLHYKGQRCIGGKHSKVRLTGLSARNATGEKLPLFVIGKSAKTQWCKSLLCRYCSQKKSCLDEDLFTEWVKKLDQKCAAQDRNIALIVNNFPSHPIVGGMNNLSVTKHNVKNVAYGSRCY